MKFAAYLNQKGHQFFFTHPVGGDVDDSMQKYGQHIVQLIVTHNSGWTKDNKVVQRLTTINHVVRPSYL